MTTVTSKLRDEPGRLGALARLEITTHSSEASFDHITDLVRLIFGMEMTSISIIDENSQILKARHGLDLSQTPRETAFCNIAIRSYEPLVIEDTHQDPRVSDNPFVKGPPYLRSYIGAPLTTSDGYNLGTLCSFDTRPRRFEPREIEILRKCADLVVNQLELRSQANRDVLTGALNRRSFVTALTQEISRLRRRAGAAVVAFLDIDHFKRVNDTYGHPAGDRVLQKFTRIVAQHCRVGDKVARLGGEEFAVLLPDTDLSSARIWAERMCSQIAESRFDEDGAIRVTASIGLVELGDTETTIEAITQMADDALYRAKRLGRNRVVA